MAIQKFLFSIDVGLPNAPMKAGDYMEFDDVNNVVTCWPGKEDKVSFRFDPDNIAAMLAHGWIAATDSTPGNLPGDITAGSEVSLAAGSNVIGAVTQSGSWTFMGSVADGASHTGVNPVLMGGSDGTLVQSFRTDTNGYPMVIITNGTQNMPTMDAAARRGYVTLTDGTNSMPTGDSVARGIYNRITDGTNQVAVTAANTAASTANPGLVTSISPNLPVPTMSTISSTNTTNATSVKASAGTVFNILVSNTGSAAAYLKLYNKASAPTVGTDVPVITITVPANGVVCVNPHLIGIWFSTGIALAITNNAADSDTTAVATAQVKSLISYI
jgi:hypothetical protein